MVETEYILCASVWYKDLELKKPEILEPYNYRPNNCDRGIVFSGWRHGNCMYQMVAITGIRSPLAGDHVQGFLTNTNRFVGRVEAAQIALAAKQIKELTYSKVELYSEDLY